MQLTLIGAGLIGGSAAWAMKKAGIVDRVHVYDLSRASAERACAMGIADAAFETPELALEGAGCVMSAVPVLAMPEVFAAIRRAAPENAYITDVGSVRSAVIDAARRSLGRAVFLLRARAPDCGRRNARHRIRPQRPLCGRSGDFNARRRMKKKAVDFWEQAWKASGSVVVRMTPAEHDEIFASVSHLPHVLSYAMVDSILQTGLCRQKACLCRGGLSRLHAHCGLKSPDVDRHLPCEPRRDP